MFHDLEKVFAVCEREDVEHIGEQLDGCHVVAQVLPGSLQRSNQSQNAHKLLHLINQKITDPPRLPLPPPWGNVPIGTGHRHISEISITIGRSEGNYR
jgi:hypothetical protein